MCQPSVQLFVDMIFPSSTDVVHTNKDIFNTYTKTQISGMWSSIGPLLCSLYAKPHIPCQNQLRFLFLWSSFDKRGFHFNIWCVCVCSGAVWRDPLHSAQPDCILEVHAEHVGPADRLPIQPRLHGPPGTAHQRADLSACRRRSHQHAVTAQLHLVRKDGTFFFFI